MRTSNRPLVLSAILLATAAIAACNKTPSPPPVAPVPMSDSAVEAVVWVQSHASGFVPDDSSRGTAAERAKIYELTAGARVIGFSEMTEGTHEFPYIIRRALFALADSGVRGIALQASMADAMDVDRYVRGGPGDLRKMLRTLNPPESQRISSFETASLVEALREWNRANPAKQIGFYGFEIPTAARAVRAITTLPDSVLGAPLKAWLTQKYSCVAINEGAHWGIEGRSSDSTFWAACGPATTEAMDSVIALHQRSGARHASDLAFAEQAARLIQHHVKVGLSHPTRHDGNAEHVMFLLDQMGQGGRLVLWGGDMEMARMKLDSTTIQTAVPLSAKLGAGYRAIAFTIGDGVLRARAPGRNSRSGSVDISNAEILPPSPNTFEDVFIRANPAGYWLDLRSLPNDKAGGWLKGPRPMRVITETYISLLADQFETSVEIPANFDAVVFVKRATPAHPY